MFLFVSPSGGWGVQFWRQVCPAAGGAVCLPDAPGQARCLLCREHSGAGDEYIMIFTSEFEA